MAGALLGVSTGEGQLTVLMAGPGMFPASAATSPMPMTPVELFSPVKAADARAWRST